MTKITHGGQRPNAGRKPGQGTFAGGRKVSTRKLSDGQTLTMRIETPEGNTPMSMVRVDVISRTRIELVVTKSNAGMDGEKIVLIS